jgi:hypothetical protein
MAAGHGSMNDELYEMRCHLVGQEHLGALREQARARGDEGLRLEQPRL